MGFQPNSTWLLEKFSVTGEVGIRNSYESRRRRPRTRARLALSEKTEDEHEDENEKGFAKTSLATESGGAVPSGDLG
jgi:hypothetical protein